ncbi:MAG TPA: hypothetical protein VF890_04755 [Gemmatimonadales bacterium]
MRRLPLATLGVVLAALGLTLSPVAAQQPLHVTAGLEGAFTRARSRATGATELLSGATFGGEANLAGKRWRVRLGYGEGRLTADTGTAAARSVTEGRAQLGIAATPWLTLWAGPRARSYKSSGVRQRWWFWEVAAEARGTLFADRAFAFGGLAVAPAGTVDALPAFSRETAVTAGLAVRLPFDGPWTRLGYRVDQTRLAGGRRETVEAISLGVSMELPPR